MCCNVPKKVCEEVPRTVYDTISRRQCHDFADIVCADVQEQKCPISQKPVQETVSHQQCSSQSSGPFLTFITNLLRCQGDLTKMTLSHEMPRESHLMTSCLRCPRPIPSYSSAAVPMRGSAQTSRVWSRGGSVRTWPSLCALTPTRGSVLSPKTSHHQDQNQ